MEWSRRHCFSTAGLRFAIRDSVSAGVTPAVYGVLNKVVAEMPPPAAQVLEQRFSTKWYPGATLQQHPISTDRTRISPTCAIKLVGFGAPSVCKSLHKAAIRKIIPEPSLLPRR